MSVIVYEHINLRGAHKHINRRDEPNLHRDNWGDRISSIQIFSGTWDFFQNSDYGGQRVRLGPGNYSSVTDIGIQHDTISSIRRYGGWWAPRETTRGLIVYEHSNFRGHHKHIIGRGEPNLHVDGWGDRISSIQITSGMWRLCQHVNYRGWSTVLTPGNYPWVGSVGINNDELSSIRQETEAISTARMPAREIITYEHIDFRGDHKHFINRGERSLHADGWGDRISSLEVVYGPYWTLYEHIDYAGSSINPQGSHRWIEDIGMRNDSASSIRGNIIPIYVKVIQGASTTNINRDISAANSVFNQYGIEVFSLGQETNIAPTLLDLDQPTCFMGQTPTSEEDLLYNLERDHAPANIVVYYLRSTNLGVRGCAAFPVNRPGCVVANSATQWTLAHELGHVLGLSHFNNTTNLMNNGTALITSNPPVLTPTQLNTIRSSQYLV